MKRLSILLLAMLVLTGVSNVTAQRTLKKGFSISMITGFPSSAYGLEEEPNSDDYNLGTLWGIQLGNRWYIAPTETFGVGIMANWIDFSLAAKGGAVGTIDWARAVMDITLLEAGPIGTYAINDDIAIDGYYNFRPTILTSALVTTSTGQGDETYAYAGFGLSHTLGAAFRWKVLNVGIEYVAGGINSVGTYSGPNSVTLQDQKIKSNNVRLLVGVKF